MNREELEAEMATLDLVDAAIAAKDKVRGGDTSDEALAELAAAKEALANHRRDVRSNRVPTDVAPEDGVATPETVAVTAEAG